MATAADMGWGSYLTYEGVFYRGKHPFRLPSNPNESDRVIAVITATEGGRLDAYNGYDRCVCTSGVVQWCEAGQYSVSDMLGKVAEADPDLLKPVDLVCLNSGLEFHKNVKKQWRFHFRDGRGEVNTLQEQQQMFLLNSNGKKGTWDDKSKLYAKQWAAAISSVWEQPRAQQIQLDYTAKRLLGFALPYAKELLAMTPPTNVGYAFKAMYLSFAANNPTWANRHLKIANDTALGRYSMWSIDWLIHVAKELTFGPKVSIYPHRYSAIRPVLEKLYGVNLPDLASELEKWKNDTGMSSFFDPAEVKRALVALGYDMGEVDLDDSSFDDKAQAALLAFEQAAHVPKEHINGMPDIYTVPRLEEALYKRGKELLT